MRVSGLFIGHFLQSGMLSWFPIVDHRLHFNVMDHCPAHPFDLAFPRQAHRLLRTPSLLHQIHCE